MYKAAESQNLAFLNHSGDFQQKFCFWSKSNCKNDNLLVKLRK